jgi:hypothetical protein
MALCSSDAEKNWLCVTLPKKFLKVSLSKKSQKFKE